VILNSLRFADGATSSDATCIACDFANAGLIATDAADDVRGGGTPVITDPGDPRAGNFIVGGTQFCRDPDNIDPASDPPGIPLCDQRVLFKLPVDFIEDPANCGKCDPCCPNTVKYGVEAFFFKDVHFKNSRREDEHRCTNECLETCCSTTVDFCVPVCFNVDERCPEAKVDVMFKVPVELDCGLKMRGRKKLDVCIDNCVNIITKTPYLVSCDDCKYGFEKITLAAKYVDPFCVENHRNCNCNDHRQSNVCVIRDKVDINSEKICLNGEVYVNGRHIDKRHGDEEDIAFTRQMRMGSNTVRISDAPNCTDARDSVIQQINSKNSITFLLTISARLT